MSVSFFYNIPNYMLMILFIIVAVILSIIGLYIFNNLVDKNFLKTFNDQSTSAYINTAAVVLAVVLAFIVSDEWQKYSDAEYALEEEANVLYSLYKTTSNMTNSQTIQSDIIKYICHIINVDFPNMEDAKLPPPAELETNILKYQPTTEKDFLLYDKSIDLLNEAINLRNKRLQSSTVGVPKELWWVILFGCVIIVIMLWFLSGSVMNHVIMTSLVVAIYASLLFLAVAFDYPFRGEFSLSSDPFKFVLDRLNVSCPYKIL
jgi:ABC-type multidrug transport system fused ATPase/permease subunit